MRKAVFRTILILSFLTCAVSAALPMWKAQSAEGSTIYLTAVNFIFGGWHTDEVLADYGCIMSASDIRFVIAWLVPLFGLVCANFLNPGKKRYYVISLVTALLGALGFVLTDRLFCYADLTSAERMIQTTRFIYPCLAAYALIPAVCLLGFILFYFFPDRRKDSRKDKDKQSRVKMLPAQSETAKSNSAQADSANPEENSALKDSIPAEENSKKTSPEENTQAPESLFCPECGNKVSEKDRFCANCGKPLQ